jgi:hypothetical protein
MVDIETFRNLALSFPGTIEQPHFDRAAFKVTGKRIFTTLHEPSQTVNVKLPVADQAVFCAYEDAGAVYPVPNKFGLRGWTTFELARVSEELIAAALHAAYMEVVEKKVKK